MLYKVCVCVCVCVGRPSIWTPAHAPVGRGVGAIARGWSHGRKVTQNALFPPLQSKVSARFGGAQGEEPFLLCDSTLELLLLSVQQYILFYFP